MLRKSGLFNEFLVIPSIIGWEEGILDGGEKGGGNGIGHD
jgi:hypothetical protein